MTLLAALVVATGLQPAAQNAPPPAQAPAPGGPPVQLTVTVKGDDARRMAAAVKILEDSDDEFLVHMAVHAAALADALSDPAHAGSVFGIGPLTEMEQASVSLEDYLAANQDTHGSIRLQIRGTETIYTFTPVSLLSFVAAVAKGPMVQLPAIQELRSLVVGRLLLDLNQQAGGIVSDDMILAVMAKGFHDKRVGERLIGIVQAMCDDGTPYDLVPAKRLKDFQKLPEPIFFTTGAAQGPNGVTIKYGEILYSVRQDHVLWALLRLFSGGNSKDWAERAEARERLAMGKDILDYLEVQVRAKAIEKIEAHLGPPGAGPDIALGDYRARGAVVTFLKDAPVVVRKSTKGGTAWVSVFTSQKKLAELKAWLERKKRDLAERV